MKEKRFDIPTVQAIEGDEDVKCSGAVHSRRPATLKRSESEMGGRGMALVASMLLTRIFPESRVAADPLRPDSALAAAMLSAPVRQWPMVYRWADRRALDMLSGMALHFGCFGGDMERIRGHVLRLRESLGGDDFHDIVFMLKEWHEDGYEDLLSQAVGVLKTADARGTRRCRNAAEPGAAPPPGVTKSPVGLLPAS